MQTSHRDFISAIQASLTDVPVTISDDADYKMLFLLAKKHQMVPLVLNGLYKLKGDIPELNVFKQVTFKCIGFDQTLVNCLNQIENTFAENGIDYMLLKGSSIKKLYPSSEYRLMVDIDILIKEEQYDKIKEVLPTIGLQEHKESDHEIIWVNIERRHSIELHKRLVPSYDDDYYAYYCNPWKKASYQYNHSFSMSKEDEYIFLFTHFTKHYRDGSALLRPFVDLWLFQNKYPLLNKEYIYKELEKLELNVFYDNIIDTMSVWFDNKENTELTDFITEQIIANNMSVRMVSANAARQSARTDSVSAARVSEFKRLVFLPLEEMKKKFPVLVRFPILLPLMWAIRWINAIFNKKDSIAYETNRLNHIEEQVVDDYNNDLKKVGLKFNLKKK